MKRSTAVALVLSGSVLTGCNRRHEPEPTAEDLLKKPQVVTNDTYIAGRGYYHSPFHGFYPFPYNYYSPGSGYYRGGSYHPQPDLRLPPATVPGRASSPAEMQARAERERAQARVQGQSTSAQSANRGGFTRYRSWSSHS